MKKNKRKSLYHSRHYYQMRSNRVSKKLGKLEKLSGIHLEDDEKRVVEYWIEYPMNQLLIALRYSWAGNAFMIDEIMNWFDHGYDPRPWLVDRHWRSPQTLYIIRNGWSYGWDLRDISSWEEFDSADLLNIEKLVDYGINPLDFPILVDNQGQKCFDPERLHEAALRELLLVNQ